MGKYKKRKDGRYSTSVWDGTYDKDGRKHYKKVYGRTMKEVDAKVRDTIRAVEEHNIIKKDAKTFLAYAGVWFHESKSRKAAKTKEMYKDIIERYFSAEPDVKLEDFRYIHAKRILDKADGKDNTQNKIILTIKQVLRSAVRDRLYPQAEMDILFACFPKIRIRPKEKRILTASEKEAVSNVVLLPREKAFLYLIFGCGLRREEALALTPFDFDFKGGFVRISKALVLLSNNTTESKVPKSENGVRSVPMPQGIRAYIEDYAKTCSSGLFPDMTLSKYRVMWRHIKAEIERLAPDSPGDLTAHIFRHNYCTELCYQIPTLSIKNVARLLGDSEAMVLKVYSHIDLDREPAKEVVSSVFTV